MTVFIVGLRRSGTTAFWGMWRQDERFTCYNEPFNAQLSNVGDPTWPGARYTGREYDTLYREDPALFWQRYAPIPRHGELQDDLSDRQAAYLAWLLSTGTPHACVDVTRCHFKLDGLRSVAPDAVLVHLYRPPANWVTSVVQPSTTHLKRLSDPWRRARHAARLKIDGYRFRRRFWSATDAHRFKGFNELIGGHPGTLFGFRLAEAGLDPDEVYAAPDIGRLLAFWKIHYERVEREGARLFGDRFVSVNFNDFCRGPDHVLDRVYEAAGLDRPPLDTSGIRSPPAPFAAGDPRWAAYADRLGLPDLA